MVQSKFNLNKGGRQPRRGDRTAMRHASDLGDAAFGRVDEIKSTVSRTIMERPFESVLIAMGVGALCGRFRRSAMAGVLLSAGAGLAAGLLLMRRSHPSRR